MIVCLLCNRSLSVVETGNIERHYKTIFWNIIPITFCHQNEKSKPIKKSVGQQTTFFKTNDKIKDATEASDNVPQISPQKKKPYANDEMIKEAFLESADSLFFSFRNK